MPPPYAKMHPMNSIQTCIAGIDAAVTAADVRLWLETVPRLDPDGPRAAAYVRGYNVASKIARAKQEGAWPPSRGFIAQ